MSGPANGRTEQAALLVRLQRLQVQAKAVGRGDRAAMIALIDEVARVRRELVRQSARTDEELKRAAMRVLALTAYARSARAIGRARH